MRNEKGMFKTGVLALLLCSLLVACKKSSADSKDATSKKITQNTTLTYPIVDTSQINFFDDKKEINRPKPGDKFFGQDANYNGYQASYKKNGDGTISDMVTGLMWISDPGEKVSFEDAVIGAEEFNFAGYDDWRLPSVKELYSLIRFNGLDVMRVVDESTAIPFINNEYFEFSYGDESKGERIIDSQYWTSSEYGSTIMDDNEGVFGVNFADGRIKCYPKKRGMKVKLNYALYVRGNEKYGINDFVDNMDGTISDHATGLMWMQDDSSKGMTWEEALEWAENAEIAGYDDWRLPNAKELQSLVDYSKSPDITNSAAIDDIFYTSQITDEEGKIDYPFYWTGTTHENANMSGEKAVYIAFGEALGYLSQGMEMQAGNNRGKMDQNMQGEFRKPPRNGMHPPRKGEEFYTKINEDKMRRVPKNGMRPEMDGKSNSSNIERKIVDAHGAGAQRSDPKSGNPDDYEMGKGPQGDVVRIFNYVRLVRDN